MWAIVKGTCKYGYPAMSNRRLVKNGEIVYYITYVAENKTLYYAYSYVDVKSANRMLRKLRDSYSKMDNLEFVVQLKYGWREKAEACIPIPDKVITPTFNWQSFWNFYKLFT